MREAHHGAAQLVAAAVHQLQQHVGAQLRGRTARYLRKEEKKKERGECFEVSGAQQERATVVGAYLVCVTGDRAELGADRRRTAGSTAAEVTLAAIALLHVARNVLLLGLGLRGLHSAAARAAATSTGWAVLDPGEQGQRPQQRLFRHILVRRGGVSALSVKKE